MLVMKIGGSVLINKKGFDDLLNIITMNSKNQMLIVVSAFAKTTSLLGQSAKLAEKGSPGSASGIIDSIFNFHSDLINNVITNNNIKDQLNDCLNNYREKLLGLIKSIAITGDLSNRILDSVLYFGELTALRIVSEFLKNNNFDFIEIDSTEIIITDDNFVHAKPILDECEKNITNVIKPLLENHKSIVTQGFTAKTIKGDFSTMGMESSNLTAAIYTAYLGSKELTIWTNVEGIRSADPFIVEDTHSISKMGIFEAIEASRKGLKLIYPEMLEFAEKFKFNIVYKSASKPDGESTFVSYSDKPDRSPFIVSADNLVLLKAGINSNVASLLINSKITAFSLAISKDSVSALVPEGNLVNMTAFKPFIRSDEKISVVSVFNCSNYEKVNSALSNIPENLLISFEYDRQLSRLCVHLKESNASAVINLLHKYLAE